MTAAEALDAIAKRYGCAELVACVREELRCQNKANDMLGAERDAAMQGFDYLRQRAERAEADLAAARALTTEPVAWQLISQRGLAETWMRMTPPIDHTQDWRPLYALAAKDAP